ncbi:MAG: type VI secretion system-associated FHA domain protein [Pseudorhodobacter sp.]
MLLTLELLDGPDAGAARIVDGMHAFSVGTKAGLNWVLPGASSEGHVKIRSKSNGFEMDPEGDVMIENQPIANGVVVRLSHGSIVSIGGISLRVSLSQQGTSRSTAGLSGLTGGPTISSILSDISPGGDTAQGLLPGRGNEEWLSEISHDQKNKNRAEWGNLGKFGTRDAEGRVEENEETDQPLSAHLPEDWNAPGDRQNKVSQSDVSRSSVRLGRKPSKQPKARKDQPVDPALTVFFEALGISAIEQDALLSGNAAHIMANAGTALRHLLDATAAIETAQARALSELEIMSSPRTAHSTASINPLMVLGDRDGETQDALQARLAGLADRQAQLIEGVASFVTGLRNALDPDAIAARVASGGGLRKHVVPSLAAWQTYREIWEKDAPLSSESLARVIAAHLSDPSFKESEG